MHGTRQPAFINVNTRLQCTSRFFTATAQCLSSVSGRITDSC